MTRSAGRFVRDSTFLVAAVSLPAVVVVFFLLSSAIPRWMVPPPAYDLLLHTRGPYDQTGPRVAVDFNVQNGRVEATVRPLPATAHWQRPILLLVDHETMNVREIPLGVPDYLAEGEPPRTVVIDAIASRRVLAQPKAPDGYELEARSRRGPGIVGDLFGMHRYDRGVSLVNKGRVVQITLPSPYEYRAPVYAVGWLVDEGPR